MQRLARPEKGGPRHPERMVTNGITGPGPSQRGDWPTLVDPRRPTQVRAVAVLVRLRWPNSVLRAPGRTRIGVGARDRIDAEPSGDLGCRNPYSATAHTVDKVDGILAFGGLARLWLG